MGLKPKYKQGDKVLFRYESNWIPVKVDSWRLTDDLDFEYNVESIPTRENEPTAVYCGLEHHLRPCEEPSWDHEEV